MDNPNKAVFDFYPPFVESRFVQKIHYFNPGGQSNDIQTLVPHYSGNYVDYWDGYYLWNPNLTGNQWYHFKTNNFSQFKPGNDEDNPISIKNVAIPDRDFDYFDAKQIEVDFSTNKNPIPWTFVATGSVIMNNTKSNGSSWFNVDEWGNKINPDAKLAFFSTFDRGIQYNASYIGYSNNNEQFHPIAYNSVFDATMLGQSMGSDFRDPYLTTANNGNTLVAYVAGGWESKIDVLTSNDGKHWNHQMKYDIDMNKIQDVRFKDRVIETPYVTTINNQPIMFFGVQNKDDRSWSHVGYVAGYMTDAGTFQFDSGSKYGFVDDGFDNYAGNFTQLDENKLIYLGWMGNWGYFNGPHNGGFTLARVLTWDDNAGIKSIPVEPGEIINSSSTTISANQSINFNVGKKVSLDFNDPVSSFDITLTRTDNANNKIKISLNNGILTYSRTGSGNGASDLTDTSNLVNTNKISRVNLYLDNISVEVYLPEAQKMYTMFSYDNENIPYQITSNIPANVTSNDFDTSKTPSTKDYTSVNNNYIQTKRRWNGIKDTVQDGDRKQNINASFALMTQSANEISDSVNRINQTGNDARKNVYSAIINNGVDLINSKLQYTQRQSI